mgnify:CR=1 FL=1
MPHRLAEGFDDALIGVVTLPGDKTTTLAYDLDKCIETLETRDGMSRQEAEDYLDFNVVDAWVGPGTPIFIEPCSPEWVRAVGGSDD